MDSDCAICVDISHPQQYVPDLQLFGQAGHVGQLALRLIKAGDIETNPDQWPNR